MTPSNKIILIIDDNALLVCMYQLAFEKEGYTVVCAHDGAQGYHLAKKIRPAHIILDLLLPGMSAFDLLNQLKSDPETQDISVIALTLDDKGEDEKRAKELGVLACLLKANLTIPEIVQKSAVHFA